MTNTRTEATEAEADAQWDADFVLALSRRGLDSDTAIACSEEAAAHCAESGESLRQAFGDPEQYADTIVAGRTPLSQRVKTDYDDITMDEYWGSPLLLSGFALFVGGILAWINKGLWIDVTVAGLVGAVLLVATVAVAGSAHPLRAAGFRRASIAVCCVALAMAVPTALALFELPHAAIGLLPTPVLVAAGALLNWLGERLQKADTAERRALQRVFTLAGALRPAARRDGRAASDRDTDVRRWLTRLEGLLRGRHYVNRSHARRLVADAREHLEATGARPEEEFGDVERYALSLVEEGHARRPSRNERRQYRRWAIIGVCSISLVGADWPDLRWYEWGYAGLALLEGLALLGHYRKKWASRVASSAGESRGASKA